MSSSRAPLSAEKIEDDRKGKDKENDEHDDGDEDKKAHAAPVSSSTESGGHSLFSSTKKVFKRTAGRHHHHDKSSKSGSSSTKSPVDTSRKPPTGEGKSGKEETGGRKSESLMPRSESDGKPGKRKEVDGPHKQEQLLEHSKMDTPVDKADEDIPSEKLLQSKEFVDTKATGQDHRANKKQDSDQVVPRPLTPTLKMAEETAVNYQKEKEESHHLESSEGNPPSTSSPPPPSSCSTSSSSSHAFYSHSHPSPPVPPPEPKQGDGSSQQEEEERQHEREEDEVFVDANEGDIRPAFLSSKQQHGEEGELEERRSRKVGRSSPGRKGWLDDLLSPTSGTKGFPGTTEDHREEKNREAPSTSEDDEEETDLRKNCHYFVLSESCSPTFGGDPSTPEEETYSGQEKRRNGRKRGKCYRCPILQALWSDLSKMSLLRNFLLFLLSELLCLARACRRVWKICITWDSVFPFSPVLTACVYEPTEAMLKHPRRQLARLRREKLGTKRATSSDGRTAAGEPRRESIDEDHRDPSPNSPRLVEHDIPAASATRQEGPRQEGYRRLARRSSYDDAGEAGTERRGGRKLNTTTVHPTSLEGKEEKKRQLEKDIDEEAESISLLDMTPEEAAALTYALWNQSSFTREELPTLLEICVNALARVFTFGASLFFSLSKFATSDFSEDSRSQSPIDPAEVLEGLHEQPKQVASRVFEWLSTLQKTSPDPSPPDEEDEIVENRNLSGHRHAEKKSTLLNARKKLEKTLDDVSSETSSTSEKEESEETGERWGRRRRRLQRRLQEDDEEVDPYVRSSSSSFDETRTTDEDSLSHVAMSILKDILDLVMSGVYTAAMALKNVILSPGRRLIFSFKPTRQFFSFIKSEWESELKKRRKSSFKASTNTTTSDAQGTIDDGIDVGDPIKTMWHFFTWFLRQLLHFIRAAFLFLKDLFKMDALKKDLIQLKDDVLASLRGGEEGEEDALPGEGLTEKFPVLRFPLSFLLRQIDGLHSIERRLTPYKTHFTKGMKRMKHLTFILFFFLRQMDRFDKLRAQAARGVQTLVNSVNFLFFLLRQTVFQFLPMPIKVLVQIASLFSRDREAD
ncbi:hypothetical protein CSUI_001919 [Cystoisospora suis]|uniref:Uncharacterized protein n=1 Tax=Cystoisospora suis TaxID=483139 RepID=A0A2C6LB92_9APIC|nr:hypothetical protein CSUI_001919 [Cystoisospora suis]